VEVKPAILGEPGTGRMPFDLVITPEKTASPLNADTSSKLQKE
jgi:hypothetical protein